MLELLPVAEQFLDLVPPLLEPAQRQGQGSYAVAHHVVSVVFTQANQVLAVEVEEGLAQLQAELAARGLPVTVQARTLLVPLGGDDTYDVVRDCVAALALPLCRLEQRRHQVEELFRDEQEVPHA